MTAAPAPSMTSGPRRSFLMRHPWIFFAIAGIVILTLMRVACGGGRELGKLVPIGEVPSFELVDQAGKPFGLTNLRGTPWIASFFFTSCKTECPAIMQANARVLEGLKKAGVPKDKVRLVSFSVDPEWDTPEVLRDYALNYPTLDGEQWKLVTGPRETLEKIIIGSSTKAADGQIKQVGFATAWGARNQEKGGLVRIAHAQRLVLVDGQGLIRHYFDANDPTELDNLVIHAVDLAKEQQP